MKGIGKEFFKCCKGFILFYDHSPIEIVQFMKIIFKEPKEFLSSFSNIFHSLYIHIENIGLFEVALV